MTTPSRVPALMRVQNIRARWHYWLGAVLTLLTCGALLMHRNPTLILSPQLWAEDLQIYFIDERLFGLKALSEPYSGYVQFCCRLIAALAALAPTHLAPRLYESMFILAIVYTIVVTYTSPAFRAPERALAAVTLLAAPASSEIFLGMSYTHWVIAPIAALALYECPSTRGRAAVLLASFLMIGLSSPFALIAAPFVVCKMLHERTRYAAALLMSLAVTAAFNFFFLLNRFAAGDKSGDLMRRLSSSKSILYGWFFGPDYPGFGPALLVAICTTAAVTLYLCLHLVTKTREIIYFFGYGAALFFVGCISIDPTASPNQYATYGRYFYLPVVLFIWTFIAIEQNTHRRKIAIPLAGLFIASLYIVHVDGVEKHFQDVQWHTTADCLVQGRICSTPANPSYLGQTFIPSDYQLKQMSAEDRRRFDRKSRAVSKEPL